MRYKGKDTPFFETPYPLWILLALPMLPILRDLAMLDTWTKDALRAPISPTGQYGAWLIIIALMATPLSMLFKGRAFPRWLVRNRRYFGVAGFLYGLVHTVFYLAWRGPLALNDARSISILSGWILLAVLLPLAATSTDGMVRRLGPKWKKLQRWSYVAGALTFVHWITLHRGTLFVIATLSFLPLVLLVIYRLRRSRR
ncbi:MAG TPA: iron reductase [Aliiroseovarius sp.]|nr:iron reductase [Aliiroseovarius sp.]